MLHALTRETKTVTTQGKSLPAPSIRKELHSFLPGMVNQNARSAGVDNTIANQQLQNVAGLQSTHGNQAILRDVSELRTQESRKCVEDFSPAIFWMLGHQQQGLQSVQLVAEHLALLGKGNLLLHHRPDPKELAHFIEGSAEARCRGHASEPTHGMIALLDTTMVLLQSIVEITVGSMEHLIAQGLADGTRIGIMPIGRDPLWGVINHSAACLKKRLAASISRFSLSIESTRLPSRSMVRYR